MTATSKKTPKVTVLMPVYNGEKYLNDAIDSILGQTFQDFEFLIVNDGSTDNSVEIIKSYDDTRIRLFHNEKNLGVARTLNKGMELARGEYIARMDSDDISLPRRLKRQTDFMDSHPVIGACGAWFRRFGDLKSIVDRPLTDPQQIRCGQLFNSRLGHPTVMMRLELFRRHALFYDPDYKDAEDFELWMRALESFELANVGEVLLLYRVHSGQVSENSVDKQLEMAGTIRRIQLRRLGIEISDEELSFHQAVCTGRFAASRGFLEAADNWLCRIKEANDERRIFPDPAFSIILLERWFSLCFRAAEKGLRMPWLFLNPKILKKTGLGRLWAGRFLAKTALHMTRDKLRGMPAA